ncbi:MAG: NACHT domain-containing protein, partial [Proteobacteria bacterium]|nr:NACHT domain-containing protein [Pseudomonadota bacterium]
PQSDISELVSHINQTQGERIVFVFDGFDEYVPYYEKRVIHNDKVPSSNVSRGWSRHHKTDSEAVAQEVVEHIQVEGVFELLNGKTLTKSTIFVTSRPAACNNIREYAKKQIEVVGFLKPQIIEYVNYYFSADKFKAQQLVAHLEHHPNLMHMAYLPLHCAMLAFLFDDDTFLPETETEFYEHFTLSTLLRSLRRQQGSITIKITSFDRLPQREKTIFDKVCKLAFNASVNSKQVFTSADIESILPGTDSAHARDDISDLGLIVADQYFMRYGLDDIYTFLHLAFQEYLAAVYVAGLSESERMDTINKSKARKNLSVVWKFLCGIMDFSYPSTMDTFKSLMHVTEDKLVKIQCCYETRHRSACEYVIHSLDGQLQFLSNNVTASDCAAIGYTVNKCYNCDMKLRIDELGYDGLVTLMQEIRTSTLISEL